MNEEEIRLFAECEDVLRYINEHEGTALRLLQVSADVKDMKILDGNKVLYRDNLQNCRMVVAGMLLLTDSKGAKP